MRLTRRHDPIEMHLELKARAECEGTDGEPCRMRGASDAQITEADIRGWFKLVLYCGY